MTISRPSEPRSLEWWERKALESQGCSATDWDLVAIGRGSDLSRIVRVEFEGRVETGLVDSGSCIRDARLRDCTIGDRPVIRNVGGEISGAAIGSDVVIENVGRIEFEKEAPCGVGVPVSVLDETGSRPVWLYPGLSAQVALIAALKPRWAENVLKPMLDVRCDCCLLRKGIGDGVRIRDVQTMVNVAVWPDVSVHGALSLVDGLIVNNAAKGRALAEVGSGVDAENFVIEDGYVGSGALIRNCFVGQGVRLEKGFTAHDSLFFANCSFENGEACAVFAGPYTVSMHKSSLLIGGVYSFMNAGSGSNASNHMYKLGPVHWGVMQRGVKTSSGSYMMWGGRIGPFSLLMGSHKSHPDTQCFPFSYLFGDDRGETTAVPAMMLRSCGLLRDEKKWPTRDRRLKRKLPMHDRINFDVLNPFTVGLMADALDLIAEVRKTPSDADRCYRINGMKIRSSALERAEGIYKWAICKYLDLKCPDGLPDAVRESPSKWIDLGGQLIEENALSRVLEARCLATLEQELDSEHEQYAVREQQWIARRLSPVWKSREAEIRLGAESFDKMVDDDRRSYLESLAEENALNSL